MGRQSVSILAGIFAYMQFQYIEILILRAFFKVKKIRNRSKIKTIWSSPNEFRFDNSVDFLFAQRFGPPEKKLVFTWFPF